jgi:hypothetical protein
MSHLSKVEIPVLPSFELSITPPSSVTMSGTIAIPDPGLVLGATIRAMHEATLSDQLQELSVDVRGLTFVNSSAIRLFVDWSSWVGATRERGYVLRFRTDRRITWQRTSFAILQSLGGKAVSVTSE